MIRYKRFLIITENESVAEYIRTTLESDYMGVLCPELSGIKIQTHWAKSENTVALTKLEDYYDLVITVSDKPIIIPTSVPVYPVPKSNVSSFSLEAAAYYLKK